MESVIAEIPDQDIRETLHTLKHIREESAGNIYTDPISGKELKTTTRRLFFLTEIENHTKLRILEAA